MIITGGAGFIGSNAAEFYAKKKWEVIIFDNLSRKGSNFNKDYLLNTYSNIKFIKGDINSPEDMKVLSRQIKNTDLVLHLAAQTAVTYSVLKPVNDFNVNAKGTLNLLEAVRKIKEDGINNPIIIYSSTNKVYGKMENIKTIKTKKGYNYIGLRGINEKQNLEFYTPYGCSKGTGDQYMVDYHKIYGLRTVVMRQSCIYGYRQYGVEDQGWVAWFMIANILNKKVTIYGDGYQVRDLLFVDDLINAYDLAAKNIKKTSGKFYNIGGGIKNALSVNYFLSILEKLSGNKIKIKRDNWRPGDQKVCIMDCSKAKKDFEWEPKMGIKKGIPILYRWLLKNRKDLQLIY